MDHPISTPCRPMAYRRDADAAAAAVADGPLQRHYEDRVVGESVETRVEVVVDVVRSGKNRRF